MSGPIFVDTNVLVYARDASEPVKQPQAQTWLAHIWKLRSGRVSAQVLGEYYVTLTRKLKPGLSRENAWRDVEDLFAWHPVGVDSVLMERARRVETRFGLSWWDALVVAAAQTSGCAHLLTEDLQEGRDLDGVRIVNPFHASPADVLK